MQKYRAVLLIIITLILIALIAMFFGRKKPQYSYIIFHGDENFITENEQDLRDVVKRTNILLDYLDLDSVNKYQILRFDKYTGGIGPNDLPYETSSAIVREYIDTVHVYWHNNDPYYDLTFRNISLNSTNYESEKELLHELVHHRLNDHSKKFVHYKANKPECMVGERAFWCTNLMSFQYIPFSVMLNGNQHIAIQDRQVSLIPEHYCQERNTFPKDNVYLSYQDTIQCCTGVEVADYSSFYDSFDPNIVPDEEEVNNLYVAVTDTLNKLFAESEEAFCTKYLSLEIINRLKRLLVDKDFIVVYLDAPPDTSASGLIPPPTINKPAGLVDSSFISAYNNFFFSASLDNESLNYHFRKEAEILASLYNEDVELVYARNRGFYQKKIIIEANEHYKGADINFAYDLRKLKFLLKKYKTFEPLPIKGIMYKGVALNLSTRDLAYLISYLQ